LLQAWKQVTIVASNQFDPFEFFGTMKVEKLNLEETKPWLNQIFMKTQRSKKRKRPEKSKSISMQLTGYASFSSNELATDAFGLKDITN
jgi:hypothetical protein